MAKRKTVTPKEPALATGKVISSPSDATIPKERTVGEQITYACGSVRRCLYLAERFISLKLEDPDTFEDAENTRLIAIDVVDDYKRLCNALCGPGRNVWESIRTALPWLVRSHLDISLRLQTNPILQYGDKSHISFVDMTHDVIFKLAGNIAFAIFEYVDRPTKGQESEYFYEYHGNLSADIVESRLLDIWRVADQCDLDSVSRISAEMEIEAEHARELWEQAGSPPGRPLPVGDDDQETGRRFQPGPCPRCSGKVRVTQKSKKIRRLLCTQCAYSFKKSIAI